MNNWRIYHNNKSYKKDTIGTRDVTIPPAPPWRRFSGEVLNEHLFHPDDDVYSQRYKDEWTFLAGDKTIDLVNAALHLRRPLLISGNPGSGKSSLAYDVARELKLGAVLRWSITSSTKLSDGLYHYDAIGRLQETTSDKSPAEREKEIGKYIRLGPLGSALIPSHKPRVLLIDEIDKSDIDLPNDLLHVFEEGEFEIPELVRLEHAETVDVYYGAISAAKVAIKRGHVRCREFPFIFLTSNDERQFPPAFLRRCLRLQMEAPNKEDLLKIVKHRFVKEGDQESLDMWKKIEKDAGDLVKIFAERRELAKGNMATDQLLNVVYLIISGMNALGESRGTVIKDAVLEKLSNT